MPSSCSSSEKEKTTEEEEEEEEEEGEISDDMEIDEVGTVDDKAADADKEMS